MRRTAAIQCLLMAGFLFGALLLLRTEAVSQSDPLTYRGGIRNHSGKYRLKEKELKRVLEDLASKTGLRELSFDVDGFLTLGNRAHFVGGSATARQLVIDAVDFSAQLILENHSYSQKVVFANLGASTVFANMRTKVQIEHQPIRIDFADFNKLVGPKEVRDSFDLGITILHELVHGVRKLHDSVNEMEEVGDCERYVNTIRKELGLPERQQYIARSQIIQSSVGWAVKIAELQFARTDFRNGQLKTDEYKLSWDVNRVGVGEQDSTNSALKAITEKKPEQKSTAAMQ